MLLSTGIPKLDEVLKGGVDEGSSILLLSTPGIDCAIFAYQIINHCISSAGIKSTYLIDNKTPDSIKESLKKMAWNYEKLEQNVEFIDAFSSSVGMVPKTRYAMKKPGREELNNVVKEAIESMKEGSVFIADSLSSLLSKYDEGILEGISYWIENAKGKRITTIFLFTNWNYPQDRINRIARMFDYVVNLKTVEEKVLLRNYFSVVKAPKEVLNANVPFRIGMDGISIYIPKILVTGPFHSGKSTFIHKVSVRAVSVDRMGTTIALDHGYIDYGGLTADLFGTPGQERFDFMLDILNKDTFGVVCIVDSTNPGTFQRAKEMIEQVAGYGLPYVIAANKQDLEGALTPEQVRAEMGLSENIPVMPTVATTGEGCVECVKKLIDLIVTQ